MTKKHFIAFAREIASSLEPLNTRCEMARLVAGVAQQDNPRFDTGRFFKACGPDVSEACGGR